jgi:hypothetical protein
LGNEVNISSPLRQRTNAPFSSDARTPRAGLGGIETQCIIGRKKDRGLTCCRFIPYPLCYQLRRRSSRPARRPFQLHWTVCSIRCYASRSEPAP